MIENNKGESAKYKKRIAIQLVLMRRIFEPRVLTRIDSVAIYNCRRSQTKRNLEL